MVSFDIKAKIFLVEDDLSLGDKLRERLEKCNYKVFWAKTLKDSLNSFHLFDPNLFIIDIQLPDGSGFDLVKSIQTYSKDIPFIFLTAQSAAEKRLKGFDLGAKDFIPKPFHFRELILRLEQVLEVKSYTLRRVKFEEFIIDFDKFSVIDDKEKTVTEIRERDCHLLSLLIKFREKVVSRDEILNKLWGEDNFPTNRTIDNSIVRLRQAFKKKGEKAIKSVRGVGYRWIGEIQDV